MKKSKKTKEYNLLMYVQDSTPKIKKFDSMEKMGKFVDKFLKDNPDHLSLDSGNWVDYCISGITGEVSFFTDGLKVE